MADVRDSQKVVVVTGDVTMDWNLARTRRSDSGGAAWNADDFTRAYWQRGGAAIANYAALLQQMGYNKAQVAAELDKVGRPFGIKFGSDA